jgi:hypothetical protein
MSCLPCGRTAGPGLRADHEDFLSDIGYEDMLRVLFERCDDMALTAKRKLGAYLLTACYEAYEAGITRAKDAMDAAI